MMSGLDSIVDQFNRHDVPLPPLPLDTSGRKVVYGKGKKSWYRIREWVSPKSQRPFYFGHIGHKDQWHELETEAPEMTQDERARLQAERERAAMAEQAALGRQAALAASRAQRQWLSAAEAGESSYLTRKGVRGESCRYMGDAGWEGWIIIPLYRYDETPARLVGSQKISPDGVKRFNAGMAKKGAAVRLGDEPRDGDTIWLCEGYATGGSIRAALAYSSAVYVAQDAGNLIHVARILRARFPTSRLILAADDDWRTEGNPGRTKARAAAEAVGNAHVVMPVFLDECRADKETDFNDLHAREGLAVVAAQLLPAPAAVSSEGGSEAAAVADVRRGLDYLLAHCALIIGKTRVWDTIEKVEMSTTALRDLHGKEAVGAWLKRDDKKTITQRAVLAAKQVAGAALRDEETLRRFDAVLDRYVHLDGSESIFDLRLHKMISQSAMKLAVGEMFGEWVESAGRRTIPFDNVVFDPTMQADGETHINLFRDLPLKRARDTSASLPIQDLIAHLVNGDVEAFHWLVCWLAYPLQHKGAKMATAVLMHGDVHGTGKSMFFEGCYKPIFGEYASTLGQHQLESQYTAWRSRKLFCLFEEVLSNSQKYSHTGVLKHMITGKTQNIEKKFVDAWEEANHMNGVFLSNAHQPFNIEPSDRRFLVVWPETKLPEDEQQRIDHAIKNGAVEAFYGWLLDYDLGDFGPHTKPPMTEAKRRLIDYGLPGWEVFYREWTDGSIGDGLYRSCLTGDLHDLYVQWCERGKEGKPLSRHKFGNLLSTRLCKSVRHYRIPGMSDKQQRTFFVIGRAPDGMSNEDWLGSELVRFRDAARDAGWSIDKWE